ncbi:DarT ssDNA thymidine ADP-ribosyltransferase family protein [Pseudorhodobacter aquimaris]|uniref:DarT ssDNA thymidine ADP-ribosyltransferase family protein n=1 Tax=Pseudorhodobacter aquimaris TaxID=687412 RepID=UPI0038CD4955
MFHVDRLQSIMADGCLWSDAEARQMGAKGTTVGVSTITDRTLHCHGIPMSGTILAFRPVGGLVKMDQNFISGC